MTEWTLYNNERTLELNTLPTVENIYKTEEGKISVDTDNIVESYYYNEFGDKVTVVQDPEGRVEIDVPEGVTPVYFVDIDGRVIEVEIPDNTPTIDRPTIIVDGTDEDCDTLSLGIDDKKEIETIICYNEDGEVIGTITGEDIDENGLVRVPKGTATVEMDYTDGTMNTVEPEVEEEPEAVIEEVHGIGDGKISMKVTSVVGIKEVQYKVDNVAQTPIELGGVKEAVIELPANATDIVVVDIMGKDTEVEESQNIPTVSDVQKDEEGNTRVTSEDQLYYKDEEGNLQIGRAHV